MARLKYFYCNKCQVLVLDREVKPSIDGSGHLVHSFEITSTLVIEHRVVEEP